MDMSEIDRAAALVRATPILPQGALRPMLQRGENARRSFCAMVQERADLTDDEAQHVLDVYLKLKVAKIDFGIGRVNVKHGALLDRETIKNAAKYPLEQEA